MHHQPSPPIVQILYQHRWYSFDPSDPTPIRQLLAAGLTIALYAMLGLIADAWRMTVAELMAQVLESEEST
jgi:hypothetical protein